MGKKKRGKKRESRSISIVAPTTPSGLSGFQLRSSPGGRTTIDDISDVFQSGLRVLSPFSADRYWRDYGLDQKTLDRVPLHKLVELLIDLSPDVSKGLWDWQRLFNPGYDIKVFKLKSKQATIDEKAQGAVNAFLGQLHGPYSVSNQVPANLIMNTVSMQAFLRGSMFAELVLDETGRVPLEIATPDPQTVTFRRDTDDQRGKVWQLGQYQGGMTGLFTPLDRVTVIYLPVDPLPGQPFGRPLINPAIFATLFLIGLLHDLRRVVAQQGYPRLDLIVDMVKLKELMPRDIVNDPLKSKDWFAGAFRDIEEAYSRLEPDDAYVHMDAVTVSGPVGAATGTNLAGLDGVIKALEEMLARALKTMPLMQGTGGKGVGESNANRQWEIQAAGIKAIQHLAENLFERLLTLALQVQGMAAEVQVRFSELRAAEELRDQQTLFLKIRNARMLYDNGTISADQMAEQSIGQATADQPEPRDSLAGIGGQVASINAEPGSQRWVENYLHKRNATAQALLLASSMPPSGREVDEAIRWFEDAVPDATGILNAEPIEA